jgi:hypothetical protein
MLALGIGANTAIFSVVDAVLLRGLPYPASERLVMAFTTYPDFGHSSTSLEDFRDWRDGFRGAGELAAFANASFNVTGDGAPERAVGAAVTANYFRVLGAPPSLGRAFLDEEERGATPGVAMLGHEYWRRRFGGDPRVVGRTITLNGVPRTIVGVGPAGLLLPRTPEVLVPVRTDSGPGRRAEYLSVVGRLAPGATVDGARRALAAVARRLRTEYPETNSPNLSVDVTSMQDEVVGAARPTLLVLAGRRRPRAPGRLRERGQPPARPRHHARARGGDARRPRRERPGASPASSSSRAWCSPAWAAWPASGSPPPPCARCGPWTPTCSRAPARSRSTARRSASRSS